MILYRKLRDLRSSMQKLVTDHELVVALFESMPELREFSFVRSQEYDDNNYYDNTHVDSVNGWPYGYEGYEDESEEISEEERAEIRAEANLPKIPSGNVVWIEDVVGFVASEYESGDESVVLKREEFQRKGKGSVHNKHILAERRYFTAYLSGKKLPDSFFIKNDVKLALYYALDHGRFKEETEFRLFAKRGQMLNALEYAQQVIKGRLPSEVENFFILDASDEDRDALGRYSSEFLSVARSA